jgi:hypothetical protein
MRMGKRSLAGVAAGALGLGMMTFVGATSAQAASVTGSASAIRAGAVGTIPSAKLSIAKSISVPTSLTVVTAVTSRRARGSSWSARSDTS